MEVNAHDLHHLQYLVETGKLRKDVYKKMLQGVNKRRSWAPFGSKRESLTPKPREVSEEAFQAQCQDWLFVRSKADAPWKRRYVSLYYDRVEWVSQPGKQIKRKDEIMWIDEDHVVARSEEDVAALRLDDGAGRTVFLAADSEASAKMWLQSIGRVVAIAVRSGKGHQDTPRQRALSQASQNWLRKEEEARVAARRRSSLLEISSHSTGRSSSEEDSFPEEEEIMEVVPEVMVATEPEEVPHLLQCVEEQQVLQKELPVLEEESNHHHDKEEEGGNEENVEQNEDTAVCFEPKKETTIPPQEEKEDATLQEETDEVEEEKEDEEVPPLLDTTTTTTTTTTTQFEEEVLQAHDLYLRSLQEHNAISLEMSQAVEKEMQVTEKENDLKGQLSTLKSRQAFLVDEMARMKREERQFHEKITKLRAEEAQLSKSVDKSSSTPNNAPSEALLALLKKDNQHIKVNQSAVQQGKVSNRLAQNQKNLKKEEEGVKKLQADRVLLERERILMRQKLVDIESDLSAMASSIAQARDEVSIVTKSHALSNKHVEELKQAWETLLESSSS